MLFQVFNTVIYTVWLPEASSESLPVHLKLIEYSGIHNSYIFITTFLKTNLTISLLGRITSIKGKYEQTYFADLPSI